MALGKSQKNIIYPEVKIRDVLRAFWRGAKPQKWQLFVLVFSLILTNILFAVIPIFYKGFFDIISSNAKNADVIGKLLSVIIKIAFLNAVIWALYRLFSVLIITFESGTIARLKQQAYDYMMDHSYSFFANNFTGSLVQRVNRFARSFETLTDRLVWDMLQLFVRITSVIIIVSFINKWIALVILLWISIFFTFNIIFSRWKVKYDIEVAKMDSKTTAYLADTITNQNTIQLFNGYNSESKGYKSVTNEQARMTKLSWNLDTIMEAGQSFLGFLIEFLLFFFAIKYWERGLITIGFFVMLQVYIISLIDQLWGFTRVVRNIYQAYADAREMVEIMLLPHEIKDKPSAKELIVKSNKIEFEKLKFSFNETRQVLGEINLKINPGEKVALVGPSGAGKTTLVRLLLRLYSPSSGKILIDGQDISEVTQESLRKNISMVPQDPALFHRTLEENISYGMQDAEKQEVRRAATLAHCDEFIKDLPQGFETYVGERGIKLSGGERQRVAIARAILKSAPILVLDEATSSLDSNSESLIQDALNNLMAGKTTIVIAHRLSTIQKMDRIIVIDGGKIVEQGSHSELLAKKNSLYKKLWKLQSGGFLKDQETEEEAIEDKENGKEKLEEQEGGEDGADGGGKVKMVSF